MSPLTSAYRPDLAALATLSALAAYVMRSRFTILPLKLDCPSRKRTNAEPMNPHPPVTKIFCGVLRSDISLRVPMMAEVIVKGSAEVAGGPAKDRLDLRGR